ncbi:hypothetical protein C7S16_3133 [Burkholderia thailandensis]|uniref:Uncharacterized protein n=1 Tax=Burkholderia thailandensis TaxID=57975 RepID=A0AAW9D697_BURTH|nr:hypothetical protein [Burkholderia thailandensis]MDW9257430.1 hypothetical protein [Burkholderia thailandensis]
MTARGEVGASMPRPRCFGCVFATLTECFRCDALPHGGGAGGRGRPGTVTVACYHGRRRMHHIGPHARVRSPATRPAVRRRLSGTRDAASERRER